MSFTASMTRRLLAPGLIVVFAVSLVLAGCGGSGSANTSPTATTPPAPTATTAAPTATTAAAATNTPVSATQVSIDIQNFAFSPQSITIKTGTAVTWTDKDSTPHTVTSDSSDPASFNSGPLAAPGGTFKFTFAQAGTYTYHCMIHPNMTATIIVVS